MDPIRKALPLLEEFKTFAFKGNVIDMAVGVIIGAAFGKIIDSLVKHIIMPVISLLLPGHYASERFAMEALAELLGQQFGELEIWPSREEKDPLEWI